MHDPFWTFAAVSAASSLVLGAYGRNVLRYASEKRERWERAAQVQLVHSLALMLSTFSAPANRLCGSLFAVGLVLGYTGMDLGVLRAPEMGVVGKEEKGRGKDGEKGGRREGDQGREAKWQERVRGVGFACLVGGWLALAWDIGAVLGVRAIWENWGR